MKVLFFFFFVNMLNGDLALRPARADEVDILYDLIVELARYEKKDIASLPLTKDNLQRFGFGDHRYFLTEFAEVEGEVVGYALYFFIFSGYLGSPVLYVEDLYVKPEFRGCGIAESLLKHLARLGLAKDCCRMEGHVFSWNASAIRFYESLGAVLRPDLIQVRLNREELEKFSVDQPPSSQ